MKTLKIIAALLLLTFNFVPVLTQVQDLAPSLGSTFVVTHTSSVTPEHAATSDNVKRDGYATNFAGTFALADSYGGYIWMMTEGEHSNIEFAMAYKNYIIYFDFDNAGDKFEGFSNPAQYFRDRKIAVPYFMDLMYLDNQKLSGKVLIVDTYKIWDENEDNKLGKVTEVDLSTVEIKKEDFLLLFGFAPWGLTTNLQIRNSALESVLGSIYWETK